MKMRISAFTYGALTALTRAVIFAFTRWEVEYAGRVPGGGGRGAGRRTTCTCWTPRSWRRSCRRRVHPMAKRELFEVPLIGWIFWVYGAFPVRRFSADIGALRAARNRLKNGGDAVLMFPEGTRARECMACVRRCRGRRWWRCWPACRWCRWAITGTEDIRLPGSLLRWLRRRPAAHPRGVRRAVPAADGRGGRAQRRGDHRPDDAQDRGPAAGPSYRGAYGPESEGTVVFARQARNGGERREAAG